MAELRTQTQGLYAMRVFALIIFAMCSSAFAQEKDVETAEGPCVSAWKTAEDVGKNRFAVLSDEDWRVDVEKCVDQEVINNSISTVGILIKDIDFRENIINDQESEISLMILEHGDRTPEVTLNNGSKAEKGLCQYEKFRDQYSMASCSGVIVSSDTVLTAGHCLERIDSENPVNPNDLIVIMDLKINNGKHPEMNYSSNNERLRRGVWTAIFKSHEGHDLGVIKLDRPVSIERISEIVEGSGSVSATERVYGLGHPNGLPMKLTPNGTVVSDETQANLPPYFSTDLSMFHGNSGGPVYSVTTHELEGVVRSGRPDWYYDSFGDCATSLCKKATGKACATDERISRANAIPEWMQTIIGPE